MVIVALNTGCDVLTWYVTNGGDNGDYSGSVTQYVICTSSDYSSGITVNITSVKDNDMRKSGTDITMLLIKDYNTLCYKI